MLVMLYRVKLSQGIWFTIVICLQILHHVIVYLIGSSSQTCITDLYGFGATAETHDNLVHCDYTYTTCILAPSLTNSTN